MCHVRLPREGYVPLARLFVLSRLEALLIHNTIFFISVVLDIIANNAGGSLQKNSKDVPTGTFEYVPERVLAIPLKFTEQKTTASKYKD